ncbi:hypothetical protein ACFY4K_20480 [Streptomyces leeuwenhoekii]|jgi:hypothetical protein|uniref:hypothetical protein n=1 Tax=Streptomyces leeuwenhoekii TaxID=1437453 RepID=UPI0036B15982
MSTEEQILHLHLPTLLRHGIGAGAAQRPALFGEGAVAAAVTLDRLGVQPRAVAFLAKTVRSGGVRYAAGLEEPFPGEEASRTAQEWLAGAASVAADTDDDETVARWFEAVAEILALRHRTSAARR